MKIEYIAGITPYDKDGMEKAFSHIAPESIAYNNWAEAFPYAPEVEFRLFHTGNLLFIRFDVSEHYTMGCVTEDNGEVWTDSCVEFFIAADDMSYYNFETTCIGTMLLGFRSKGNPTVHADTETMGSVIRIPSYERTPFAEREGNNRWSLTLAIPPSALFRHTIRQWDGVKARVNFFKCGDKLSHPHFLSWRPISASKPNFHLPEFFGEAEFMKNIKK